MRSGVLRTFRGVTLVACVSVGLGVWSQPVLGNDGDPQKGKVVYERYCMACHGARGKGNGPAAKSLTPPPADLTSADVRGDPDEELLGIIRNGKPRTAMQAWMGKGVSEQGYRDVLAYVRTLSQ